MLTLVMSIIAAISDPNLELYNSQLFMTSLLIKAPIILLLCLIRLELILLPFQEFLLPSKCRRVQHRLAWALLIQNLLVDLVDVEAAP
jgi:hypothetical protein